MIEEIPNEEDEESFRIADWSAPWVDDGERLFAFVDALRNAAHDQTDREDAESIWKIGCLFLSRQLEQDITLAKMAKEMGLNTDI